MDREVAPLGILLTTRSRNTVASHTPVTSHCEEVGGPKTWHLGLIQREVTYPFHPVGVLLSALLGLEGHQGNTIYKADQIRLHKVIALHPILPCYREVVLPDVVEINKLQCWIPTIDGKCYAFAEKVDELLIRL